MPVRSELLGHVALSLHEQVACMSCLHRNSKESGGFAFTKGTHSLTFFLVYRDQRFQQLIIEKEFLRDLQLWPQSVDTNLDIMNKMNRDFDCWK